MHSLIDNCTLKPVNIDDEDLILQMRNQDFVRSCMLNQDIISEENHHKWFHALLNARDKAYFIFLHDNKPAGVIGFFDICDRRANWSFYLGSQTAPKGLGSTMCFLGLENIFKNNRVSEIKTCALNDNAKSIALHLKLGFDITGVDETQGATYLRLQKSVWNDQKKILLKAEN